MTIVKNKILYFFAVFSLAVVFLPGQELPEPQAVPDDALFVITGFNFDITGRTRPFALIRTAEFRTGTELSGYTALEDYIRDKTQTLYNQRILKNNPQINYSVAEQREDGIFPVTLFVIVEDSWNIIALPRPYFKNDVGFDMTIKARDYNFLGTMNPLRLDMGYNYDLRKEEHRHSFHIELDTNIPFRAYDYDWNFRFTNLLSFRPGAEEPLYFRNITGLSVEVPYMATTFTFGIEEHFTLNEENSDWYWEEYGLYQNGLYMTTRMFTSWRIPTGLLTDWGELAYTPGVSARFIHELPSWPLDNFRRGPFLDFNHSLGFSKVDWNVNYRRGFSAAVINSYTLDVYRLNNDKNPLSVSLTARGTGHFIVNDFLGISSRIMYQHWFLNDPDFNDRAARDIRGITDRSICANYMFSFNVDFPFRVLLFEPSVWFGNRRLSFFDFELHGSPVIDFSLFNGFWRNSQSSMELDYTVSGGFELVVFPAFMRNFIVRLGYAWNLREQFSARPFRIPDGENCEVYFIMGHHF